MCDVGGRVKEVEVEGRVKRAHGKNMIRTKRMRSIRIDKVKRGNNN